MPLNTFYDKTHLCRTSSYRRLFRSSAAATLLDKPGCFIEDVLLNKGLSCGDVGLAAFILRQGEGPVVYHLNGRKLRLTAASGCSVPPNAAAPATIAGHLTGSDGRSVLERFAMFQPKRAGPGDRNRKFAGSCFRCGEKGHSARNCPNSHVQIDGNFQSRQ
jgi:hypothetical protein